MWTLSTEPFCGSFNFQKLYQGFWCVIKLLGVFCDFMLKWGMMGAHGCMGVVFVSEFNFFLQQKLVIVVLKLQLCD